jgi:hypothetical protein
MTTTRNETTEQEFRERTHLAGQLSQYLTEYLWSLNRPLTLDGEKFECVGGDEVPGYEEDEAVVLLRRKSDGKVFEVELEADAYAARPPAPATTGAQS